MSRSNYQWNHNFPQIARESGFRIRRVENGFLDWRLIGTFDVDRLIKANDLDRLESAIGHLGEAPLVKILTNSVLDPAVVKYFALAQLAIQFLLFCKEFLDKSVTSLRNNLYELQKENGKLQKVCKKRNAELLDMHERMNGKSCTRKCCKNSINWDNALNDCNQGVEERNENDEGHGKMPDNGSVNENDKETLKRNDAADQNLISTIKLELEIKQLQERLLAAERELKEDRRVQQEQRKLEEVEEGKKLQECFKSIGIQSNLGEEKERDDYLVGCQERNEELMGLIRNQLAAIEEWKCSEKRQMFDEICTLKRKLEQRSGNADLMGGEKPKVVLSRKPVEIIEICTEESSIGIENKKSADEKEKEAEKERERWKKEDELRKVELHWQEKYQQLERLYQRNQVRLDERMQTLENRYRQDQVAFKAQQGEKPKKSKNAKSFQTFEESGKKIDRNELLTTDDEGDEEANYSLARKQQQQKEKQKQEPVKGIRAKGLSKTNETVIEPITSLVENRTNKIVKNVAKFAIVQDKDDEVELDGEGDREDEDEATIVNSSESEAEEDFKGKVVLEYEKRLSDIGIDPRRSRLSKSTMKEALERLAELRDKNKKKWRNFYIIRNKVVAKVNQLTSRDLRKSQEKITEILEKEVKKPQSIEFGSELDRSSSPILVTAFRPETNLFQESSVEDVSLIEAEEEPEKRTQELNQEVIAVEINREQPVVRLLYELDESGTQDESSEEVGPVPPKPLPRKRVIFNLHETATDDKISSQAPLDYHYKKAPSDWSSLSSIEEIKDRHS